MHRHDHHFHWHAARRHFRGGPPFAFFEDEFGGPSRFGRQVSGEDLRLLILHLLSEAPRHGYDLIKAIEELSQGAYSPSPGVIYPALTFLEEGGFASGSAEGNRKIFQITDAGREHVKENREALDRLLTLLERIGRRQQHFRERLERKIVRIRRHLGEDVSEEADFDIEGVIPEVNEARRALKEAIRKAAAGGPEAQRKLAGVLRRAARELGGDDIDLG
jgi:DNA-binding PadR family transcriptional regulator